MYHLGPKVKTFIDGRTDMFLPEVLPEYISFGNLAYTGDDDYLKSFEKLVSKYQISYATLTNNRYTLSSRLSRVLEGSENWTLVFFDDTARIYINRKGADETVASEFALQAVTPFSKKIYRSGFRQEAFEEYQKMDRRAKSAVATNALGFMLLEDKKYDEAKKYFLEALQISPSAAAPKMNLAELSAKDGDYKEAISLYRQAIADEPDRGLAYLRLGQLIIDSGGSGEEAKSIWEKGLQATPDEDILAKIRKVLEENNH